MTLQWATIFVFRFWWWLNAIGPIHGGSVDRQQICDLQKKKINQFHLWMPNKMLEFNLKFPSSHWFNPEISKPNTILSPLGIYSPTSAYIHIFNQHHPFNAQMIKSSTLGDKIRAGGRGSRQHTYSHVKAAAPASNPLTHRFNVFLSHSCRIWLVTDIWHNIWWIKNLLHSINITEIWSLSRSHFIYHTIPHHVGPNSLHSCQFWWSLAIVFILSCSKNKHAEVSQLGTNHTNKVKFDSKHNGAYLWQYLKYW